MTIMLQLQTLKNTQLHKNDALFLLPQVTHGDKDCLHGHHCKNLGVKLAIIGEHNFVCYWGHLPCTAIESSAEDMLLVENSRSLSFLAAFWAFLRFFWLGLSPHRLVPPYMLGIFRSAIPSNLGPLARSKAYPSHWQKKKSTKLSLD